MTGIEAHADVCERMSAGRNCTFRLTLFATTLVVAVTAYVLSAAFLNPSAKAPKTQRQASRQCGVAHAPEGALVVERWNSSMRIK